jgi:hypothetical protein
MALFCLPDIGRIVYSPLQIIYNIELTNIDAVANETKTVLTFR